MINQFEQKIANWIRNNFPGYDYLAVIYKILIYTFHSKQKKQVVLAPGYSIEDAVISLKGSTFFGYYDRPIENEYGDFIVLNLHNSEMQLCVFSSNLNLLFKTALPIWNYQQGVLATWLNADEVIFNTIFMGKVVASIYNISSQNRTCLTLPLQSVSRDGFLMCSIDIGILKEIGTEYSYDMCDSTVFSNNNQKFLVFDIAKNKIKIEFNYQTIKNIAFGEKTIEKFHINHCVFSPAGNYIVFLSRGIRNGRKEHVLMCLNISSHELIPIIKDEVVSHYNWLSDNVLVFWGTSEKLRSYHLVKLCEGRVVSVQTLEGDFSIDGHPVPLSSNEFITDTYPNRARVSVLKKIMFRPGCSVREEIVAKLRQPFKFYGKKRVDLHPRTNLKGQFYVDSAHSGIRRLYKITKS